jgi:hypothetical protein
MKYLRNCLILFGITALLVSGGLGLIVLTLQNDIAYVVWRTKITPDGKFKAIAHYSDGGATTGFYTAVSIVPEGFEAPQETRRKPNYPNEVFFANHLPGTKVQLNWAQPRTLIIRYPTGTYVGSFQAKVTVGTETFRIEKKEMADAKQ